MDMLLYIAIAIPLIAAGLVLLVPSGRGSLARNVAVAATGLLLLLTLAICAGFDRNAAGFQFNHSVPWLPGFGISFSVGVDGIALVGVLLTALVGFAGALVSRTSCGRENTYFALYLTLVGGAVGAFASTNLFFFYFFAEFEVLCSYLLIAGWGSLGETDTGRKGAERAALQMTLFVAAGAILVLLGLMALYVYGGTFEWGGLRDYLGAHPIPLPAQKVIVLLLVLGFGVLLSMWPLHVWTPPAYAAAPTAVSMVSAGVLKQLGAYGLLRIAVPLLPEGMRWFAPILVVIAIINILYGAWIALRQRDWKFLISYGSISHVGYILMGIAAFNVVGLSGVALMMFAGGLSVALLFALAGTLEEQAGTRDIARFSGLARRAPFIGVCLVMAAMAAVGLPGFAGFVSEVMVLVGGWMAGSLLMRVAVAVGAWGLVLSAVYMLSAVRIGVFGVPAEDILKVRDLRSWAQRLPFLVLLAALLAVGVYPRLLTDPIKQSAALLESGPRGRGPSQNQLSVPVGGTAASPSAAGVSMELKDKH